MGNNCIGYFIERFQCFGEIVDLPNFNRIWTSFLSNSGNRDHQDRVSIGRGAAIERAGVRLPKDQTSSQTDSHPMLLPLEWLPLGRLPLGRLPLASLPQGGFYHQRDRPSLRLKLFSVMA